jgi:hypothetical protein
MKEKYRRGRMTTCTRFAEYKNNIKLKYPSLK